MIVMSYQKVNNNIFTSCIITHFTPEFLQFRQPEFIILTVDGHAITSMISWWDLNLYSEGKWNESGFRPPLCTYRLNWARRTSWGWWDDWDDTVLKTQDSKFEPWRSETEHATSRSRRLPTILTFTRGWGRNNFVSFKPPRPGTEPRTLAWKAPVLTTTLGPPPLFKGIWGLLVGYLI